MDKVLLYLEVLAFAQLAGGGLGSALGAWLSGERIWKGLVIWIGAALLENMVAFLVHARMEMPLLLSLAVLLIGAGLIGAVLKTALWRTTAIVAGGLVGFVALGIPAVALFADGNATSVGNPR